MAQLRRRQWLMGSSASLLTSCFSPGHLLSPLFESPRRLTHRIQDPRRKDARLSALWVGHATVLLQLEDRFVLTDPVFTDTVGELSKRVVEPGLDVSHVPAVDAALISHLHFDHLSLGSLELLEEKIGTLLLPEGGLRYLTDFSFPAGELAWFQSTEVDGLVITALPVKHNGMRYAFDRPWMTRSFTGYVIEYRGLSVYFAGDTAFDRSLFRQVRQRFPKLDLAIMPIAPIQPRAFMRRNHVDPREALLAFEELGARWMLPMHFDTFINSQDHPGDAAPELRRQMRRLGVAASRVALLPIGGQRVFLGRPG